MSLARSIARKTRSVLWSSVLSIPKHVECNLCHWSGRRFLNDSWPSNIICPSCGSGVRHRLLVAAATTIDSCSFEKIASSRRILHFAPERILRAIVQPMASQYTTADFLRADCDLQLDITAMPGVPSSSYDTVMACDVLEHVSSYKAALREVHRILAPDGLAVFTVPQKDDLPRTFEDPTVSSPEERRRVFGQEDHLRIFGDDFPEAITQAGFRVVTVSASDFMPEKVKRNCLRPAADSSHPLATNNRKVFFAWRTGGRNG